VSVDYKYSGEKNNKKHLDKVLGKKHRRNRHHHSTEEQDDDTL